MASLLPSIMLLLSVLVATGVSLFWVRARARRSWEALDRGVVKARQAETRLEELTEAVQALAERHVEVERLPRSPREMLIVLDHLLCDRIEENQRLHRRLLDFIRSGNALSRENSSLRERASTMHSSGGDADLRSAYALSSRERDQLQFRVHELEHLLGVVGGDEASKVLAVHRQNESLRGELRSAQRLIRALESQLRSIEEERVAIESFACESEPAEETPRASYRRVDENTDPVRP